jgi:hypothetical protein
MSIGKSIHSNCVQPHASPSQGEAVSASAETVQVLTSAAERGRDEMLVAAFASRRPDRMVWPARAWEWVHRVARRRGQGPLVRPGHRHVPGHVPPGRRAAPAGGGGRWIQTVPGRGWFC